MVEAADKEGALPKPALATKKGNSVENSIIEAKHIKYLEDRIGKLEQRNKELELRKLIKSKEN